jgi:hypothetical protein
MPSPHEDYVTSAEIEAAVLSAAKVFRNPKGGVAHEPLGADQCRAAVESLAHSYATAGGTVHEIIENSRGAAESLSSDPFQGLSEIIQNANDVGATQVDIRLSDALLEVRHNGRPVGLQDLHAMAAPWLTTKRDDETATGRFGIGLSTLHAFSTTFEIHSGDYHVEVGDPFLANVDDDREPLSGNLLTDTMLRVPFDPELVHVHDFEAWVDAWNDSGLLFLSSVREVKFATSAWSRNLSLKREVGKGFTWTFRGKRLDVAQEIATAPDGRQWLVNTALVRSPARVRRAHKATGESTPIAVALSLDSETGGCLYAGLPVSPLTAFPVRANAQFDPMTNRQGVRDTAWNRELVQVLGALWKVAVLDLFAQQPSQAWGSVPTQFDDDDLAEGLLGLLSDQIRSAALEVGQDLEFDVANGLLPVAALAIESPDLTGLLSAEEIADIAGLQATLPAQVRDEHGRWRTVTDAWRREGLRLPAPVTIGDAVPLLASLERPVENVIALTATSLRAGLAERLEEVACVVDADGSHHRPPRIGDEKVVVDAATGLAAELGMAIVLEDAYQVGSEDATLVRDWLRGAGHLISAQDDRSTLERLAALGQAEKVLDAPLSDDQIEAVRTALEPLGPALWSTFGPGIGRAILLEAIAYDSDGHPRRDFARPCDAYQPKAVDREKDAFAVAAATTPGIWWLAPRYAQVMRSKIGRAGLGAQRFLRHLGCSTTPRLVPHAELQRRFQSSRTLGLRQWLGDGMNERGRALADLNCDFTLADLDSPDLTAVLLSIAGEKRGKVRRERAEAMLSLLSRTWRDLADDAEVRAARAYNGWNVVSSTRAYWVWRAATIPWLDSVEGVAVAPRTLRLRSPSTLAVFGPNSTGYLHPSLSHARPEVLQALGVAGDPNTHDLLARLRVLREAEPTGEGTTGAEAAAVYQALAARIADGRSSIGMTDRQLRAAFTTGGGLLRAANGNWVSPEDAFLDPPVFGARRNFVPSVAGANRLWAALQVREPGIDDCLKVMTEIAKSGTAPDATDESTLINSLRLLVDLLSRPGSLNPRRKRRLSQLPVWTTRGWTSARPVFVLDDPLLVEGVGARLPVWQPGGEATHYAALIEPLRLTLLPGSGFRVLNSDDAQVDPVATATFRAAARLLKEDLVRNDPQTERALTVGWDDLFDFVVRIDEDLQVRAEMPDGSALILAVDAKASRDERSIYLRDVDLLGRVGGGGRAVASLFEADQRLLAQAWLAAMEAEESGREAVELRLAREQAEADEADTQASIGRLRDMQIEVKERRASGGRKKAGSSPANDSPSAPEKQGHQHAKPVPPRVLVDPDSLTLVNAEGRVVAGSRPSGNGDKGRPKQAALAKPRKGGAKPTPRSGFRRYTDEGKEALGLELARRVLASDDEDIVDIRAQRRVGADAFDERGRYYELKVSARDEPDQIRLTDSEVRRAMSTPDFFLVVVSGLEGTRAKPRVRVIVDPLQHLQMSKSSQVLLSGVHQAQSLVFDLAPADPETLAGPDDAAADGTEAR